VLRDGDRIFGREQELVAACHLGAHGLDDGGRRVPAEGAHVGDVHVQIAVPVRIGEVRALALGHPDRGVLVEIVHPGHRDAARHRPTGPLKQRSRFGPRGDKPGVLGFEHRPSLLPVDLPQAVHSSTQQSMVRTIIDRNGVLSGQRAMG